MAKSLKSADQRGDAQTDIVQSHHPLFYPQLFPKALGPLSLNRGSLLPEFFCCRTKVCGKEAELSKWHGSGTCLPRCRGSREPYFSSGWEKQTLPGLLHFSESP